MFSFTINTLQVLWNFAYDLVINSKTFLIFTNVTRMNPFINFINAKNGVKAKVAYFIPHSIFFESQTICI